MRDFLQIYLRLKTKLVQIYCKLTSTSFKEVTTSPVEKPTWAKGSFLKISMFKITKLHIIIIMPDYKTL